MLSSNRPLEIGLPDSFVIDGIEANAAERRLISLLQGIGDFVVMTGGSSSQYSDEESLADAVRCLRSPARLYRRDSNYEHCSKCGKKRSRIARHCQHCGTKRT